jgi:hypothetical protein
MRHTLHHRQTQHHKPQPTFHQNQVNRNATSKAKMYSSLRILCSELANREHLPTLLETRTFRRMLSLHYSPNEDIKLTCLHPKSASDKQLHQTSRRDSAPNIIHSHMLIINVMKTDVIPFLPVLFPSNGYLFTYTNLSPHYCFYTIMVFLFQLFVHYEIISR